VEQLVTDEHEAALRSRIIAAVQAELDRYASKVMAETQKLRADTLRERDDLHTSYGAQITELTRTVKELTARNAEMRKEMEEQLRQQLASRVTETKLAEVESRLQRRVEGVTTNLETLVDGAARPLLQSFRDEQEAVATRIEVLDSDLRKFDEQAARLVVYFNDMTSKLQQRTDETAQRFNGEIVEKIERLDERVEEVASSSLRQHVETSRLVNDRSERLEERVNIRVSTVEAAIREEVGGRIAEIDAHVGRVSQGLDDTLNVLGDRLNSIEQSVTGIDARVDALREEFGEVDADSLDELKEKLSAAAGEAMLVRIDLERLEKTTGERVESANARLATVESQLADATMDVSTAVQLERLEELERAVIELAPPRLVARHEHTDTDTQTDTNDEDRGTDSGAA
jgi:uncharacterized phage infection (PIP) family protein YhgE